MEIHKGTLIKDISELPNPYPEEVFVSKEGQAARLGFEVCRTDVMKLINDTE